MERPNRVLITGGREVGGLSSFVEGIAAGFRDLGLSVQIVPPSRLLFHWRDLRDPKVLCILNTTGVFLAPFARRAICVAHGLPVAGVHGWKKMLGYFVSFKLSDSCSGVRLVTVSDYTAAHLENIFAIRVDGVVRNPLQPIFLEPYTGAVQERCYITYVGRLIRTKNLHRLLPAIRSVLDDVPGLRACIVGDGPERAELERISGEDKRIEFTGFLGANAVRDLYRRTKVFVSAHCTEALGISFLEALSQGCVVAMPASGGGIEIALDLIGSQVQLLPISLEYDQVRSILRRAVEGEHAIPPLEAYSATAVASAYLEVDARRVRGAGASTADPVNAIQAPLRLK